MVKLKNGNGSEGCPAISKLIKYCASLTPQYRINNDEGNILMI
jgi:hypothetical protein